MQSDDGSPEVGHADVTPSAPPASEIYDDQTSDATIALELQNMENDEHGVKVEKERQAFEERKEKEILKMKQVCTPVYRCFRLLDIDIPAVVRGEQYSYCVVMSVEGIGDTVFCTFCTLKVLECP
jgi:hypothetical protein